MMTYHKIIGLISLLLMSQGVWAQNLTLEKVGTPYVYFAYDQQPLLSFGGLSDFVFYFPEEVYDYKQWADWQAAHGMNHVRAYLPLSYRTAEVVFAENEADTAQLIFPYQETSPGSRQFDLTKFNEAYWQLFREQLEYFRQKGLIVHLIIVNGWNITHDETENWNGHFFNPAVNVNDFTRHLGENKFAFYYSVAEREQELMEAQKAWVRKIVEASADLGNVYYDLVHEMTRYRQGGWINDERSWPAIRLWIEAMAQEVKNTYQTANPGQEAILGLDGGPFTYEQRDWLFCQPFIDVLIYGKSHDVTKAREWRLAYRKPYIPQESWDDNGSKWSYRVTNHAVHLRKYFWKFMMAKCQQLDFYVKPRSSSQAQFAENPPGPPHVYDPNGWSTFEDDAKVLRAFWQRLEHYPDLLFAGRVTEGPGAHQLVLSGEQEAVVYLSSPAGEQAVQYEEQTLHVSDAALLNGTYTADIFSPTQGLLSQQTIKANISNFELTMYRRYCYSYSPITLSL